MSSLPIDLQKLKASHPEALQDASQLFDLLANLYPGEASPRRIICSLLENGYVSQLQSLMSSRGGHLNQDDLAKLSQTIQAEYGFDSDKTQEALRSWASVFESAPQFTGSQVDLQQLKAYDPSFLESPKRLEAALKDSFPQDTKGQIAVVQLLDKGLVEQLKLQAGKSGGQVAEATLENLAQQAEDKFSLAAKAAKQGLENWCRALDIAVKKSPPPPPPAPKYRALSGPVDLSKVRSLDFSLLSDVQGLELALRQIFPNDSKGSLVVCNLLSHGLVAKLKNLASGDQVKREDLVQLAESAESQFGLSPKVAQAGLENWCRALGLAIKEPTPPPKYRSLSGKVNLSKVKSLDSSLLGDIERLESALAQLFPQDVSGQLVVVNLFRYGLVEELKSQVSGGKVTRAALVQLAKNAESQFGLSPKVAQAGRGNWCRALGIAIKEPSPPPKPVSQPAPKPQPQPRPAPRPTPPPPVISDVHLSPPVSSGTTIYNSKVTWSVLTCSLLAIFLYLYYFTGPTISVTKTVDKIVVTFPKQDNVELGLIYCKPGAFMMGSPAGEKGNESNETQHKVTISKGFYLGKYEVTQEQYQSVMGNNPSYFTKNGSQRPVENVSWNDAQKFCRKLNNASRGKIVGYKFCLPTEAQWEYACRAGSTEALNSGKNLTSSEGACANLDKLAWYDKNSGGTTHSVGQKLPNAWGFFDMHGNVWELCSDWYGDYPSGKVTDPKGPDSGSIRVFRGGSWSVNAWDCRSAFRCVSSPDYSGRILGFRLAVAPVQ